MRESIRKEMVSIQPIDEIETIHLNRALAWLDSGAGLFRISKPDTPPMHLVSYFAVVDDGHILLVDHKNANLWLPTGGHVEPDEHPRNTVIRELFEELGVHAAEEVGSPVMITCTETVGVTAGHTDVSLWYLVRGRRHQPLNFDADEFDSIRWFSYDSIPYQRSDPHMKRFINKMLNTTALPPAASCKG